MKKVFLLLTFFLVSFFAKSQVTYTIDSIPYVPDPYNGGTQLLLNIDDIFSQTLPIGFTFNYFGINYDSMVVSSNGSVSFNTLNAGMGAIWNLVGFTIPSLHPHLQNSVMAPYQDLLATNAGCQIKMDVKGSAPYRRVVVSFDSVSLFSCTTNIFSNQIILYETTNIIEINIKDKPLCPGWNGGVALLGIEDSSGTVGYSPPNRNGNVQWIATHESWRFTPSNAGPANPNSCRITGNIYFDGNMNCTKDPGENPNVNRYVLTDVGNYYGYTDNNGDYEMLVDTGTYIVSHNPYGIVTVACPPSANYVVSFPTPNDTIDHIDFGDSTQLCSELYSTVAAPFLRYCHDNYFTIAYGNNGSITDPNVYLTLTVPDSTIASNFSMPPFITSGNQITFQLGTLLPGQMGYLSFKDSVICDTNWIGTTRCFISSISGSVPDCILSNNTDTNCFVVVAAYDPNSKEAMVEHLPQGAFVQEGFVKEDEWITYKINFQNSGSASAINIKVNDLIDANALDINSATMLGSSHLCTMLRTGNLLSFIFNGIDLPDSSSNEAFSHGWVMFKIKSKTGLGNGAQIVNNAGIFFDNNPVVNTNANILTVEAPEAVAIIKNKAFNISPNPMTKSAELTFPMMHDANLFVYDVHGRKVISEKINGTQYLLERKGLENGIYLVQIQNDSEVVYSTKLLMR